MTTRAYDHPNSKWKNPHVLLNKVTQLPACGCEVDGFGTLPQPVVIRFCPLHATAAAMRRFLGTLAPYSDDTDRHDTADLEQIVARSGRRARALLKKIRTAK